jgi:hypothetical protein
MRLFRLLRRRIRRTALRVLIGRPSVPAIHAPEFPMLPATCPHCGRRFWSA